MEGRGMVGWESKGGGREWGRGGGIKLGLY